jgi:Flp pilus assembly protein TadG
MIKSSFVNRFDSIRRFFSARAGGVAVTFALALVPIVAAAGIAVDYGRAASVKTALQAALDSAALATAKSASSLTAAQVQSTADKYFNQTFASSDASNVSLAATL